MIDWTQEEIAVIFGKIERWWKEEGKQLCATDNKPFVRMEVEARLHAVLKVIRESISPRCNPGDPFGVTVKDLLGEIENAGFQVEGVLASLLPAFPDLQPELTRRIRRGLVSRADEKVIAAAQALYDWSKRRETTESPPPPDDLVAELGIIISTRRQPAIRQALPIATQLVQHMPKSLPEPFINAMCIGLEYLLEETRYHTSPRNASATLPYDEIPEYREKAARLAAALAASSRTDNSAIALWLDAARTDPLPEVRRALDSRVS